MNRNKILSMFTVILISLFMQEMTLASTNGEPRTDFVDVSSWQGYISIDDYLTMKNEGVKGVVVKVSEGLKYVNPYAESQIRNAKLAGLSTNVYHFSRYKNSFEANQEARFFYENAMKLGATSNSVFVNDAEDEDLLRKKEAMTEEARIFKETLIALGAKKTDLYTSEYWKSQHFNLTQVGNKGWIASYPFNPTTGMSWNSDNNAWQWSGSYVFDGISGKNFDVSIDYTGYYTDKTITSPEKEEKIVNNSSYDDYIVRPGDSLSQIGQNLGINWREIASLNNLQSPYIIYPNQILKIEKRKVHVVVSGETLSEIAAKYNISLNLILKKNPVITNPNLIQISQKIILQ